MKIEFDLDIYASSHLRAFANFLTELADAQSYDCSGTVLAERDARTGFAKADEPKEAGIVYGDPEPEAKPAAAEEPAKPTRTRRTKAQIEAEAKAEEPAKLAISTGEERIDPAAEADAEQDAADEAAEHAVAEVEAAPLTHNDLRNAMGAYVKAFGMAETLEDGPGIMVAALGAPPAGADVWTASAVPVDKLGLAINAWLGAAAAGARFGH